MHGPYTVTQAEQNSQQSMYGISLFFVLTLKHLKGKGGVRECQTHSQG